MIKQKVIIYGAGGHGKVVCDALEHNKEMEIVGFVDNDLSRSGERFFDHLILGGQKSLPDIFASAASYAVVAVGDNEERAKVAKLLSEIGFRFITVIHPSASISRGVEIGRGSVVFPGAVINAGAIIGEHAIINSHATIEHDCRIGSFAHVASGVHMGSSVVIGDYSLVGTGASIRLRTTIGAKATVGVGAVVVSEVEEGAVVVGNPAKKLTKSDQK